MQMMANTIERMEFVYQVNAPTEVADTLVAAQRVVALLGTGIVAILMVVSLIMVANTIKISVFSRRKEVNIMKFVGATDAFIRLPFIVEGILLGLFSAGIAFGILWLGYSQLVQWLGQNGSSWLQSAYASIIPFNEMALPMFGGFAGAGVLIGVVGSMLFVRKHLRV